jgi:hypothetical protein
VHGYHVDLIARGQKVLASKLFPVGAELLSTVLARRIGIDTKGDQTVLLLRFAGNRKSVEFQTRKAVAEFAEAKTELIDNDESLWGFLAAVPLLESALSWRASTLPSILPKCIESLIKIYGASFFESMWQIGIGNGRMRMIQDVDGYTKEVSQAVRDFGGYFIIESTNLDLASSTLMSRVKHELDPNGVFGG